ncbi:hypothetical protein Lal_00012420 [Lupinus albus]|nr:hypothetical protein Lal_00012420 [Lupinus albus]
MEVGQHFYWKIGDFQVHAQVLITSWVVIVILLVSATLVVQTIPTFDVSKSHIGEEYGSSIPFIGTQGSFTLENNTVTSRGVFWVYHRTNNT